MKINELVNDLLNSGAIDNEEIAVALMKMPDMPEDDKLAHIQKFIDDFSNGKIDFLSEERKSVFESWVELYKTVERDQIKNRVNKIE